MKKIILGTALLLIATVATNATYAQRGGRGGMRGGGYARGYSVGRGRGYGFSRYGYGNRYFPGYGYYRGYGWGYGYGYGYPGYFLPYRLYYNPLSALYMYWYGGQWLFSSMLPSYMNGAPVGQWNGDADRIAAMQRKIDDLTRDSDGDGVPDYYDKCPNTPQGVQVDGAGCPLPPPQEIIKHDTVTVAVPQEDKEVVNEAIRDLQFDVNRATIRPESFPSLNHVADLLMHKDYDLKLAGNTDNTGDFDANMRLSKARADAVKQYLVSRGIDPSRIDAVGYGSTQPIASNDTPEGRQQNRRVEFTLN